MIETLLLILLEKIVIPEVRSLIDKKPNITDAEIIAELQARWPEVVATGTAWLDSHPS